MCNAHVSDTKDSTDPAPHTGTHDTRHQAGAYCANQRFRTQIQGQSGALTSSHVTQYNTCCAAAAKATAQGQSGTLPQLKTLGPYTTSGAIWGPEIKARD
jgi:hypothetical protein